MGGRVVRIAALIQAHHRPGNLMRLLDRVDTPLWAAYLHIDRKSDLTPFRPALDRSTPTDLRVAVYWSDLSQVAASLALLRKSAADRANTHFYLMSGQCYPIKTDQAIASRLEHATGGGFITAEAMPLSHKPMNRLSEWHFDQRLPPGQARRVLGRLGRMLPERKIARLLHGMPPYAGDSWWLLSRATVTRMLAFLDENPWFLTAFRYSQFADEMFFQTLFVHLGLKADDGCPTTTRWIEGNPNPEVIDAALLAELGTGWHFMARKFNDFYPAASAYIPPG